MDSPIVSTAGAKKKPGGPGGPNGPEVKSKFRNLYKSGKTDPNQYFSVEIYDVDLSIINGIKRIIQSDIPIPGFYGEDHPSIDIIENTGPLHNEIMSHRIGLIPIHFSEDEVENFNTDDYKFEYEIENTTTSMLNATTESIKVYRKDVLLTKKEIEQLFPKNPYTNHYILITRLRPGEKLHFKASAVVETSMDHAGFMPVSLCTFHYIQDPKLLAQLPENSSILDKERCYFRNEYGDPTAIKFEMEMECGLTAKYLISKALEILMNKLDRILVEIISDKSEYITMQVPETNNGYMFTFDNENDTLGNFLQSNMHNHYIRAKNLTAHNKSISYVGYMCPHPLEKVMQLVVIIQNKESTSGTSGTTGTTGTTDDTTVSTTDTLSAASAASAASAVTAEINVSPSYSTNKSEYIEVLSEQCRRSLSYLQDIKTQWLLSS